MVYTLSTSVGSIVMLCRDATVDRSAILWW